MKKFYVYSLLFFMVAAGYILIAPGALNAASVTDSYPAYPHMWQGLTTNAVIEFKLDTQVAMIGDLPDISYCVKKAEFSGFDFIFTDVTCQVETSDDRLTIRLYPQGLLGENALYAYKINNINFQGGGSQQNLAKYFETGSNPTPPLNPQLNESNMCDDSTGNLTASGIWPWCVRCHTNWKVYLNPQCTIVP
jgi:hypothetical protein